MEINIKDESEAKERLIYLNSHLERLNENAYRLDSDFVQGERISINNTIKQLETWLSNSEKEKQNTAPALK